MRKLNWSTIVLDLIYIALGVVFMIRPEGVESILCYILAASVAVIGLLYLGGYFIQKADASGKREGNGFAFGILLIIMAVFIVAKQTVVISLVPFLFGVMVVIRGLMFIQNIFVLRQMGFGTLIPLATGLLTMALGLFVMLFPFQTATLLFIMIGAGLMVGGITGIIGEIMMWNSARKEAHELERARDMGTARDAEISRAKKKSPEEDAGDIVITLEEDAPQEADDGLLVEGPQSDELEQDAEGASARQE